MALNLRRILPLVCIFGMGALVAHATADGPDHYQVSGVMPGDVLNTRTGPSAQSAIVGQIPPDTDGLLSFGCVGGLSFDAWQSAGAEERAAGLKTRWCLVGYDRVIGWSAGWYLSEGGDPDAMNAGARRMDVAGTEWLLRDLAGVPAQAEAWLRFDGDGSAFGDSGCNRFSGPYQASPERLSFGALAMTKRACMGPKGEMEGAFMAALARTHRVAATDRVLALLDSDNRLMATLTRRDAD